MRITHFVEVLAFFGLIFTIAFCVLAYTSPDTIAHVVCGLRNDGTSGYLACRAEL